ncbi:MAG: phosphoribosylanthranilate isomerase [Alcaligenaceae bacterium]
MTTSLHFSRTRIKICGLTRAQDVRVCAHSGADALGFVFYPPSKRFVSAEHAAELCADLPAFVSTVALFVNPDTEAVKGVIHTLRPSLLQFHGDETPSFCASFGVPYLKAFRVGGPGLDTPANVAKTCQAFAHAAGWLFDSYTPAFGGSGQGFDLTLLSEVSSTRVTTRPMILSGGLNDQNVHAALHTLKPWAVDVSSGVEDSPGIKSAQKIHEFVRAVQQASA